MAPTVLLALMYIKHSLLLKFYKETKDTHFQISSLTTIKRYLYIFHTIASTCTQYCTEYFQTENIKLHQERNFDISSF